MDAQQRRALNELIVQQTKKKSDTLDESILKQIKDICKQGGQEFVEVAFRQLFIQLEANNSRRRLLALLMCRELMRRSRAFRRLLADRMQQFITLTVVGSALKKGQKRSANSGSRRSLRLGGTLITGNRKRSYLQTEHTAALLPPPLEYAELLRTTSLECIEEWNAKYGEAFREIHLGYKYVRDVLGCEFPNAQQEQERRAQQEREQHTVTQNILRSKFRSITSEFEEIALHVMVLLKQMELLFVQVIPDIDDVLHTGGYYSDDDDHGGGSGEDGPALSNRNNDDDQQEDEDEWETVLINRDNSEGNDEHCEDYGLDGIIQEAGLGTLDFELTVEISTSLSNLRTQDNELIFQNLRDGLSQLVKTYEPIVAEWVHVLSNVELLSAEDQESKHSMLTKATELSQRIMDTKDKCTDLGIEISVEQSSLAGNTFASEMQSIVQRVIARKRLQARSSSSSSSSRRKRPLPSSASLSSLPTPASTSSAINSRHEKRIKSRKAS